MNMIASSEVTIDLEALLHDPVFWLCAPVGVIIIVVIAYFVFQE